MKESDLKISELQGGYIVEVNGRANFDYAVPLRALGDKITAGMWLQFDMTNCETMDSTFMGVLTMLALKLRKNKGQIQMLHASEQIVRLLRDLGVAKLFNFTADGGAAANVGNSVNFCSRASMLDTAQTVVDAHKALVGADESNAAKFNQVIEFAEQDVERLKNQQ